MSHVCDITVETNGLMMLPQEHVMQKFHAVLFLTEISLLKI